MYQNLGREVSSRWSRGVRALVVAVTAVLATVVFPVAAAAHHGLGQHTVARGLDNPRGLAFLPDGGLAVAEAGHAGDLCLGPGQCVGLNGQVVAVTPGNGRQTALATGLPSLGGPFGPFGLGGLAVQRGKLYSIVGLNPQAFGNPADDCQGAPDVNACVAALTAVVNDAGVLNQLKSLTSNQGWINFAGVGRFDFDYAAAHPNPGNPEYMPGDANPFGVIAGPAGGFYVIDAASNTLDFVSAHGDNSVLAFIPDPPHHKPIYDAAPTCAARTPNGNVIIATESSSLWRWNAEADRDPLRWQARTGGRMRRRQQRKRISRQPRREDPWELPELQRKAIRRLDRQGHAEAKDLVHLERRELPNRPYTRP